MWTRFVKSVGFLALVGGASGCGSIIGPVACTDEARPALRIDVRDSVTNALVGDGARIIARDGEFADTTYTLAEFMPGLAHERPGTYTVTVEAEGYQVRTFSGVRVRDGGCHVRTVSLTARMQR